MGFEEQVNNAGEIFLPAGPYRVKGKKTGKFKKWLILSDPKPHTRQTTFKYYDVNYRLETFGKMEPHIELQVIQYLKTTFNFVQYSHLYCSPSRCNCS